MSRTICTVTANSEITNGQDIECHSCRSVVSGRVVTVYVGGSNVIICKKCIMKMCEKLWQLKMNLF